MLYERFFNRILTILIIIPILLPGIINAQEINWQVVSGGGIESSSPDYIVSGTVLQTAIGVSTDGTNNVLQGYWQFFCDCLPGNANNDDKINIIDITYIIAYLYQEGPPPQPYNICSGDPNCDCKVNILDITYLIAYLYQDGPAPCDCYLWINSCESPLRK